MKIAWILLLCPIWLAGWVIKLASELCRSNLSLMRHRKDCSDVVLSFISAWLEQEVI